MTGPTREQALADLARAGDQLAHLDARTVDPNRLRAYLQAQAVVRRPDTQGRPKWPRHGRARAKREAQRQLAKN